MSEARLQRSAIPPILIMLAGIVLLGASVASFLLLRKNAVTTDVGVSNPYRGILFEASAPSGSCVLLMGSIHVLRAADHPLPDSYLKAFALADTIVFELNSASAEGEAALLNKHSVYDDDSALSDHLPAAVFQRAVEAAESAFIPKKSFDRKQAWVLSQALASSTLTQAGFKKKWGVDTYFREKAAEAGKAVAGFEELGDQLAVFSALSDARQEALLTHTLDELEQHTDYGLRGVAAWKAGDTRAIAAIRTQSAAVDPALARALFEDRHARWLEEIERRIARGETLLVIVGAAHLCGDGSVVDLLRQRGHAIDQW